MNKTVFFFAYSCLSSQDIFNFHFQFVGVEAFVTVIVDLFPVLRRKWNREIFIAGYCTVSFLIGLTMVARVSRTSHVPVTPSHPNMNLWIIGWFHLMIMKRKVMASEMMTSGDTWHVAYWRRAKTNQNLAVTGSSLPQKLPTFTSPVVVSLSGQTFVGDFTVDHLR